MTELVRRPAESALSWLKRLESMDEGALAPGDRRARAAYLAEARRLLEEEQQRARWGQARK